MVSASSTASKPFPVPAARPKQIVMYSEVEASYKAAYEAQAIADLEAAEEEKRRIQAEAAERYRIKVEKLKAKERTCGTCGFVYLISKNNRLEDCCNKQYCKKVRLDAFAEALKAEHSSYEEWLEETLSAAGPEEKGIGRVKCVNCASIFVIIGSNGFNGRILSNIYCSQKCKDEKTSTKKGTSTPAVKKVTVAVKPAVMKANLVNRLKPTHFEMLAEKLAKDAEANRAAQEKYIRENYRVEIKTVEPVKNIVAPKKHSRHLNRNLSTAIVGWTQAPKILKPTRKTICPHPFKKVHVTKEKALEFIAEHHSEDKYIHPYKCECGAIHIGH